MDADVCFRKLLEVDTFVQRAAKRSVVSRAVMHDMDARKIALFLLELGHTTDAIAVRVLPDASKPKVVSHSFADLHRVWRCRPLADTTHANDSNSSENAASSHSP